ncbi:MAG: glycoside hydrolase, partial [Oscillospiraceae bacterium]|nr:glycoside hydrolase [Oscillospiraceae bacterium]
FVLEEDRVRFADFVALAADTLEYRVSVCLAPKTSASQQGILVSGKDYSLLGQAADRVLLMTYEWGYKYGEPLAIAPIDKVRQVVEYALTEIPAEKILLGIPNYGYDWTLPFVQGESRATSISNQYAVTLAADNGVEISYDSAAQAPFFRYRDDVGREHEVWFEDARSIRAKLSLISRYSLLGAGYWNLMRSFPQNWLVLNSMFFLQDDMSSLFPT